MNSVTCEPIVSLSNGRVNGTGKGTNVYGRAEDGASVTLNCDTGYQLIPDIPSASCDGSTGLWFDCLFSASRDIITVRKSSGPGEGLLQHAKPRHAMSPA